MSKQTAVEWLAERIQSDKIFSLKNVIEQAKAMERRQIEDAYNNGQQIPPFEFAEQYYDQKYGKEASHE